MRWLQPDYKMIEKISVGLSQNYRFYQDGKNVGEFMLFSPSDIVNVVELRGFEIYPAYRGKGLSYNMLADAVAEARLYNFPVMALIVKKDNTPAVKLYTNAGFVVKREDQERDELLLEIEISE